MAARGGQSGAFGSTISRQYGAWSILLACYFVGAFAGGGTDPRIAILLPLVILGFMARHGVIVHLRPQKPDQGKGVPVWIAVYSILILALGGVLVVVYGLWMLVPLGAIVLVFGAMSVALARRRMETTVGGELVGILGLTLVAPIAEYVSRGAFSSQSVALWLLCAFFFCGSVFHVRYLVRRRGDAMGPLSVRARAGSMSIAYHTAFLVIASALAFAGFLPLLSPTALVPASLRAWAAVARRLSKPLPVRVIGVAEVLNTVFFVVLLALTFRVA